MKAKYCYGYFAVHKVVVFTRMHSFEIFFFQRKWLFFNYVLSLLIGPLFSIVSELKEFPHTWYIKNKRHGIPVGVEGSVQQEIQFEGLPSPHHQAAVHLSRHQVELAGVVVLPVGVDAEVDALHRQHAQSRAIDDIWYIEIVMWLNL